MNICRSIFFTAPIIIEWCSWIFKRFEVSQRIEIEKLYLGNKISTHIFHHTCWSVSLFKSRWVIKRPLCRYPCWAASLAQVRDCLERHLLISTGNSRRYKLLSYQQLRILILNQLIFSPCCLQAKPPSSATSSKTPSWRLDVSLMMLPASILTPSLSGKNMNVNAVANVTQRNSSFFYTRECLYLTKWFL